jgi:hypothetical protein
VTVSGGTAAMRARAHAILDGMGAVAITDVRFGRAPAWYKQFRDVSGPDWIYTTVAAPAKVTGGELWAQMRRDAALWQASVFENAYLGSAPAGQPRIRGTSEALPPSVSAAGTGSGTVTRTQYTGSGPSEATARTLLEAAATHAHFQVDSITFMHPDRLAATFIMRAQSRVRFGQRYVQFRQRLSPLDGRLGGLEWEIVDRCGNPVAIQSSGLWTNPRWLCADPLSFGPSPSAATCRKLARAMPAC